MATQKSKAGLVNKFLGHVLPGVIKPIHALWNEMIGFVFIVFAVYAGFSTWRSVHADGTADLFKPMLSGVFALLMAYFGISSFRKARKISRS